MTTEDSEKRWRARIGDLSAAKVMQGIDRSKLNREALIAFIQTYGDALYPDIEELPFIDEVLVAMEQSDQFMLGKADAPASDPYRTAVMFGDDSETFLIASLYVNPDPDWALENTRHERQHAAVFAHYGMAVSYGMLLARTRENERVIIPFVESFFPDEMPYDERILISYEANLAVTDPSERDSSFIRTYERGVVRLTDLGRQS